MYERVYTLADVQQRAKRRDREQFINDMVNSLFWAGFILLGLYSLFC